MLLFFYFFYYLLLFFIPLYICYVYSCTPVWELKSFNKIVIVIVIGHSHRHEEETRTVIGRFLRHT